MTAPSAPVITVRTDGSKAYVNWRPVTGAATYNLYEGDTAAPTTAIRTGLTATDWGRVAVICGSPSFLRLTAVNAGAEESAYSNEVRVMAAGPGPSRIPATPRGPYSTPFG